MTIHYSNRKRLSPDLEKGATFHANPDDMLPHCDFLSINAPMTPETRKWGECRAHRQAARGRDPGEHGRAAAWSTTRR